MPKKETKSGGAKGASKSGGVKPSKAEKKLVGKDQKVRRIGKVRLPRRAPANRKDGLKSFVFRWRENSKKIGSGGVMPKTKALGRLIRWPKYVKLQRQRRILLQRLVIPPALNIFSFTAGKVLAREAIKLFAKYRPETRKQKQKRRAKMAKLQAENKPIPGSKPVIVKCGFNHVTNLIETGKAKLVLIAHDVDPIELVLWMPSLCRRKNIPFAIVKSRARLGHLCHKKMASCVALCDVPAGDKEKFEQLQDKCRQRFNDRYDYIRKQRGRKILGIKTRHGIEKRAKRRQEENAKRKAAKKQTETGAK